MLPPPLLRPLARFPWIAALCFLFCPQSSPAEDIVWDFNFPSPLSQPPNLAVSDVTQNNNNGTTTMLTSGVASSGYPGASGGNNAGAAARTGPYVPAQSAFFEVTLTPVANYRVTVTDINFGARRTSTGPVTYSLYTSADNYAAPVATAPAGAASAWGLVVNAGLNLVSTAPLTLRIFGSDGSGNASANTANWRIDDLKLSVIVAQDGAPVPSITEVSPLSGTVGTAVTITGANFGAAPAVRFNGTPAVVNSVNPEGTSLSTTVPAGAASGLVTVTTAGGAANSPLTFDVIPQPQLLVSIFPDSFPENNPAPAASGTVSIPSTIGTPLLVTLTSSDITAATVFPGSVLIPAGELSGSFSVNAVANPGSFANAISEITATADGHDDGSQTVTVTNTDAAPTNVVINKYLNVGGTGAGDTVELLVTGDGTAGSTADMRRMLLKDFSASMANDGGGRYRFNDIAFFSAVKAGTLIVITDTAATTDIDPADFVLRLGLLDVTYFTEEAPTSNSFDISITEMIMIKAPGASPDGVTGAVHTLGGGIPGTQFNDAPPKKLLASGTSATGFGVMANNSLSSLADYDGTDATGGVAAAALIFGAANNNTNNSFIRALRGVVSVDGAGLATVTNGSAGLPYSGRNYFPRNSPGQTIAVNLISNVTDAPLTTIKLTLPAAWGAPAQENVLVTGTGAGAPVISVTGQEITITGTAVTNLNAVDILIAGLNSPNPTVLTDDGRYFLNIQTAGDAGVPTAIATQPAALVSTPVASLRDVDANGLPLDLNKTVAIEVVCTEEDFDSAVRTSAYGQDGDFGINIFMPGVELNLVRGNRYAITGQIIQFSGLTEISPASAADVTGLGAGFEPAPLLISVPDLLANAEAYEGRLIKVAALQYVGGNWGTASTVNAADGAANPLDVRIQSGSDALTPPNWPATITGIFGQFDSSSPYTTGWQIMPRNNADVESLGGGTGYDGWAAAYPGIGAPEDDGDGDGVSNLMEYASGSIPNNSASLPQEVQTVIGTTLTVAWAKGALAANDPALTWSIEASTSMAEGPWSTAGVLNVQESATSISGDYIIQPGTPKAFLRLKVVRNLAVAQ
jgi:hypothetical protein